MCQSKFLQKLCKANVPYRHQLPASGIAQSAGKIGLTVTGSTLEIDVVSLVDEVAGRKPQDLCLIQMAVLVVLNIFDYRIGFGKAALPDTSNQLIVLAAIPLRI